MIRVADGICIDESELSESFVRASGPGGQNVNKVATAVQLRFDVEASRLPDEIKQQLRRLAGRRLTAAGELVIEANRFRTQERNREDARERLLALLQTACERPRPRKPTRPTAASKRRRLEAKRRRSDIKRARGKVQAD